MKIVYKSLILFGAMLMPSVLQAQLVSMPMEVAPDGTTYEIVSNQASVVEGALAPVCVPGAVGKAWRLDGYSSYLQTPFQVAALVNNN